MKLRVTYEQRKEIALPSLDRIVATVRTSTIALTEFIIQLEEEALFSSFRATLHPLPLCHEFDFSLLSNNRCLWFFFHLDHFFTPVLGEEYA